MYRYQNKVDYIEDLFINVELPGSSYGRNKTEPRCFERFSGRGTKEFVKVYRTIEEIRPEVIRNTLAHICIEENSEVDVIFSVE
ncbi:hypothetical protein [Acetobacterium woodii]|uniref:hypothetical protein n=1 Tax=Acetobacterium woodii TaxID=33952 RepID=UPI0011AE88C6|nr:hypothetical protein [Acetobacterium woodii]